MSTTRRRFLRAGAWLFSSSALIANSMANAKNLSHKNALTRAPLTPPEGADYTPVVTLNGGSLPWKMDGGVKVFHLIAEEFQREFAPGMVVNCWGYNGQTPGPTIEAVEGDKVRILVTNKLAEETAVHWHGIFLPNGMDGVSGLTQTGIPPGETFAYEFTLRQHGTFMYHPHADEMVQMAMGMMGFFIVHPKNSAAHIRGDQKPVDRDYLIMLHEWAIRPGTARPDPMVMTDFNIFTFNSRVFPGIDSMVAKTGERVRIRLGNMSMDNHPIHIHGHALKVTGTDGGWVPETAQWPETTVDVPPGTARVVEFIADAPGDWPFHCHKSHHTMNPMGHDVPNMLGVPHDDLAEKINQQIPGFMAMGETGMSEMNAMAEMNMPLPQNTLPMMMGDGPFGPLEMGGMFTVIKIRDDIKAHDYRDPGWYKHPEGTVAKKWEGS